MPDLSGTASAPASAPPLEEKEQEERKEQEEGGAGGGGAGGGRNRRHTIGRKGRRRSERWSNPRSEPERKLWGMINGSP